MNQISHRRSTGAVPLPIEGGRTARRLLLNGTGDFFVTMHDGGR